MSGELLYEAGHVRLRRCRHGVMAYFATDEYIGRSLDRYGEFSEGEVELFRQLVKPGHVVVEIGANIGTHTVFLARATQPKGAVIAFEPQRALFHILCANIALNALGNVHTYMAAAGRSPGRITVPTVDYGTQGNFGGVALGGEAEGNAVQVVPLDSLNLPACHLLKIDVEGMEGEAIAGAEATIRRFRPPLYVENDRREKSAALIAQLFALDYRLFWHLPRLFNPDNFLGERENLFGRIVSVNMLCLPTESAKEMRNFREITSPDADWRKPG